MPTRTMSTRKGGNARMVRRPLALPSVVLCLVVVFCLIIVGSSPGLRAQAPTSEALSPVPQLPPLALIEDSPSAENGWHIPFEATPEIRHWARRVGHPLLAPEERLRHLALSLANDPRDALTEVHSPTSSAREVFHSRQANCVGYANLLIAAARHVDVAAFFVLVEDLGQGRRQGNLEIDEGHLAVAFGQDDGLWIYDFAGASDASHHRWRPITDLTAMALYYSNRGVEELLEHRFQSALGWLHQAVELDPELTDAWINYGVAARHAGDLETARQAYEQALELDPTAAPAYRNLAHLLRQDGRFNEAADLLRGAAELPLQSPFDFLEEARSNLLAGDLMLARGYYQKALEESLEETASRHHP